MLSAEIRNECTSTIRMLAIDAIEKANSGHPGAPMGLADIAFLVWDEYLRFNPDAPDWAARDRFVLSCGHASMLQYALLHLWGFDVSLDDIKSFRQWDSITPGHPEVGMTSGVEVTTGPLGQGVANSVGMALAAKMLASHTQVDGADFQPMNQRVFTLCSDGDLMEGIAYEAASMAGHWKLDNLIWLYDDNKITIDGSTELAFSENVAERFESQGWSVFHADGHDVDELRAALNSAVATVGQPSLIVCRTHIGYGSPNKVDSSKAHGSPLGADEVSLTRKNYGWPDEQFRVSGDVHSYFSQAVERKKSEHSEWLKHMNAWRNAHPEEAATYDALWSTEIPDTLWKDLVDAAPGSGATRKTSQAVLDRIVDTLPNIVGGSADLTGSNGSAVKGHKVVGADAYPGQDFSYTGRQIHFGIREHAMGAVTNGMLLHGGLRPFSATFLVFSDYMRPTIRLAALSHLPNIFVYTHDSIFLGEDGPTHQPVEHHWALRSIPGLAYFRPADGVEVAMSWAWALQSKDRPSAFGLTRQGIPEIQRESTFEPKDVWMGGYVVQDNQNADVTLIGTGSELHLCTEAADILSKDGIQCRVVSMPCVDLFEEQSVEYQNTVLGTAHIVTCEAGITGPWRALSGRTGTNVGIDRFGASAPAEVLAEKFGLTGPALASRVKKALK